MNLLIGTLSFPLVLVYLGAVCSISISSFSSLDCKHEFRKGRSLYGDIVGVKALHSFDHIFKVPMITIIQKNEMDGEEASLWAYNSTAKAYHFLHLIEPPPSPRAYTGIEEIIRGKKRYFLYALSSVNRMHAVSLIPVAPPEPGGQPVDLNDSRGKLSRALVVEVTASQDPVSHIFSFDLLVRHILYADKLGSILTFPLETWTRAEQQCVLFIVVDNHVTAGEVYCFPPSDYSGPEEDNLHLFQIIELNQQPFVAWMKVETKTLLILADSASAGNATHGQGHGHGHYTHPAKNLVHIWAHSIHQTNDEILVLESTLRFKNGIISIHSITESKIGDGDELGFLAVATHGSPVHTDNVEYTSDGPIPILISDKSNHGGHHTTAGLVYIFIYRYSTHLQGFILVQQIQEYDVIQIEFQQLYHSRKVHLNVLTSDSKEDNDNIHIYTYKGLAGFIEECGISSANTAFLESLSFQNDGHSEAQLLTVVREREIGVIDITPS